MKNLLHSITSLKHRAYDEKEQSKYDGMNDLYHIHFENSYESMRDEEILMNNPTTMQLIISMNTQNQEPSLYLLHWMFIISLVFFSASILHCYTIYFVLVGEDNPMHYQSINNESYTHIS